MLRPFPSAFGQRGEWQTGMSAPLRMGFLHPPLRPGRHPDQALCRDRRNPSPRLLSGPGTTRTRPQDLRHDRRGIGEESWRCGGPPPPRRASADLGDAGSGVGSRRPFRAPRSGTSASPALGYARRFPLPSPRHCHSSVLSRSEAAEEEGHIARLAGYSQRLDVPRALVSAWLVRSA